MNGSLGVRALVSVWFALGDEEAFAKEAAKLLTGDAWFLIVHGMCKDMVHCTRVAGIEAIPLKIH